MAEAIRWFCLLIVGWSLASIIAGLYKPVLVLWFLDRMNRLKVLKVYGTVSLLALIAWLLFGLL
ncbi:hypothetical protein [Mongoliitalea daihaiensis]|uniref:hypothetical protein n=1 Tax=Mongoliitalea daihaiensis TaxID=2782006 RepID=UPI001F29925E|nr:hypothetical protein [Mongoliitalea daihaiensis]UJP66073.1 hypothetical protein IPZ59_05470 [Mongoliitalea daihaiensis]